MVLVQDGASAEQRPQPKLPETPAEVRARRIREKMGIFSEEAPAENDPLSFRTLRRRNDLILKTEAKLRESGSNIDTDVNANKSDNNNNTNNNNNNNNNNDAGEDEESLSHEDSVRARIVLQRWITKCVIQKRIKKHLARTKAAFELVRIERSYVSDLNILIQVFYEPLRANNIISPEEHNELFSNVRDILALHTELLACMEDRVSSWSYYKTISDVFLSMMTEYEQFYEVFINNYEKSFQTVRTLKVQNTAFATFLKTTECTSRCRGLDLTSFLVLPVQRFPRYIVLMKDLRKHSPADHAESKLVAGTLEALQELTLHLNEAKRQHANREVVQRIMHNINGLSQNTITLDKQFLMEGILKKVTGKVFKSKDPIYGFLFKDMLVCAKQLDPANNNHRYNFIESVSHARVRQVQSSKSRGSDSFTVSFEGGPKLTKYKFCAGTPEKRDVWVKNMTDNLAAK